MKPAFKILINVIWLTLLVYVLPASATPQVVTYQARIIKPDGYPLDATSVTFKFTILNPAATCILYSETYAPISMSGAAGMVAMPLGTGTKVFPTSATTFAQVFNNATPSLDCAPGGPADYQPGATDIRKIVMQFNDGNGWQTLPAMSINAVPYAIYASDAQNLGGVSATSYVKYSTIPTCTASQALQYTGASFNCVAVGNSSTTAGDIAAALGYTPQDPSVVQTSFTTVTNTLGNVSSTVYAVSSTVNTLANSVTSLSNSVAASFSAMTSSQWSTSGTTINYMSGNVGIGTATPVTRLDVSGGIRISMEAATCAANYAGTLRYNSGNVEYCNGTSWSAFGVASSGLTSLNASTSQTQTFATGITGTVFNISTVNGVHTFNIPLAASASVTAGLLSNSDYATFTNKMNATSAAVISALGYTPADNAASGTYVIKANNLSDLTSATVARTNLGLGSLAVLNYIDLSGAQASGTLAAARLPAHTGDVSSSAGSAVLTLASVGAGVTSGTQYTKVTVDGKGRVTSGAQLASSDVTAALGFTPASASAATQWLTSGSTVSYSAGNVGIGTTTPASKLHVGVVPTASANYGTLSIGGGPFDGVTAGFFIGSALGTSLAVNELSTFTGSLINLQTNGISKFRIASDGNLNLGTTAYATRSVWLTTGNQAKLELNAGGVGQEHQAARLMMGGHNGFGANFHAYYGSSADVNNGDFRVYDYHGSTTATERFRIDNVGNVGIGTTTPVTKLDVSGAIRISMDGASCAASYAGALRYNAGAVQFCDGSTWASFGVAGTGITSSAASIAQVLGYVPANSATAVSSQWTTSGTAINYASGNTLSISGTPVVYLPNQAITAFTGSIAFGDGLRSSSHTTGVDGYYNTAVGIGALYFNTTGNSNVANGTYALYSNTTGFYNVANGYNALYFNTIGDSNVANGAYALYSNTTGDSNIANGYSALYSNMTGSSNIAHGSNALYFNTTGSSNIVTGAYALRNNRTGNSNVAYGRSALYSNQTKSESTAIGYNSMQNADSVSAAPVISYNTAIGAYSLQGSGASAANTGVRNTALGHSALKNMTSGSGNIGIGYDAGSAITTGSSNVVIGSTSASAIATSSNNVLIADGQGNERVRINSSGNVGIGTTNPLNRLHVYSTTLADGLSVDGTNSPSIILRSNGTIKGYAPAISSGVGSFFTDSVAGDFAFRSEANNILFGRGSGASTMAVVGSNVGIGTTTPNAKLSVKDSSTAEAVGLDLANINGSGSDQTSVAINLHHFGDTNPAVKIVAQESGASTYLGNLQFHTRGTNSDISPTERMRIDSGGRVGIGTASPQTKLQVDGVISPATNNTYSLGDSSYRFTEVFATNGVINTSDRREKKEIFDTNLGLNFINKLRPVSYRWNTGVDDDIHYGLIAQEAEQAVLKSRQDNQTTSIVTHDKKTDRYGVRYSELISPLIKAVQELYSKLVGVDRDMASIKAENVQLKQENAAQAKELDDVKARLEKIEKALNSK